MSGKTIFIIIITVLVTVVLMNNMDEINFWFFGITRIPKLAVLGSMLAIGFVFGFLAGRPKRSLHQPSDPAPVAPEEGDEYRSKLSDEDREYIS